MRKSLVKRGTGASMLLFALSCGAERKNHYDKNFAFDSGNADSVGDEDAPNQPDQGEKPIGEVPGGSPPVAEPGQAGKVHLYFKSYYQTDSLLRLRNGRGPSDQFGTAKTAIVQKFATEAENDGAELIEESIAGAVVRTLKIQDSIGDLETVDFGGRTLNLRFSKLAGSNLCPETFSCTDRIEITKSQGPTKTVCFYDNDNKNLAALPLAVEPRFSASRMIKEMKTYGPYVVKGYAGSGVNCRNPPKTALFSERIKIEAKITEAEALVWEPRYQDPKALGHDYAVDLSIKRLDNEFRAPYLEDLSSLVGARYFINEAEKALVGLKRFERLSIKQSFDQAFIAPMNGVGIEQHWELCEDRLSEKYKSICTQKKKVK